MTVFPVWFERDLDEIIEEFGRLKPFYVPRKTQDSQRERFLGEKGGSEVNGKSKVPTNDPEKEEEWRKMRVDEKKQKWS